MEMDFTLRVTVADRVLTLLERYVTVLERMHPAPITPEQAARWQATAGEMPEPTAVVAPTEPLAPIEEAMPPAPVNAKPPKPKRNVAAVWTQERRARQADILRKALARKRGEAAIEPPPDVIEPIHTRFVAEAPPPPPPVPRDPEDDTPRVRSFEAIRAWAAQRGIDFRTWDDLGAVNRKAQSLGLPAFARPLPARPAA